MDEEKYIKACLVLYFILGFLLGFVAGHPVP